MHEPEEGSTAVHFGTAATGQPGRLTGTLCQRRSHRVAVAARAGNRGVWDNDATNSGVTWGGRASLSTLPPLFPKLWRRLEDYCIDREFREFSDTLDAFMEYLRMRRDRLLVVPENRFTGLDNVVEVAGDRLSLAFAPEELVFMSGS